MKYTLQAVGYVLKNLIYLLPLAVLPAFFLAISVDENAVEAVVDAVFVGRISSLGFKEIFRAVSVLNFGSWQAIVFGIGGIILSVVCVALIMAMLDKHFRIGKRTFNGIFSKLNDNFISTCGFSLLIIGIYEIWSLITSAVVLLAAQIPNVYVAYIMAGIFFIGMHFALLSIIGVIYLWLPCMQLTGFRAFEALHYSYQLMAPVRGSVLFGQTVFLFACEALICLFAWLMLDAALFIALITVFYAIIFMIFCVRMQIVYFDRDHIERMDVESYYRH